ncbi:cytochrome P450 4c21 [Folsomia candida]|uniref:Cytochrome P450 4c3 n=1 Tax=Folsomia candida TaxID=158441 RepID=A0A226EM40_FOLCA|nr:cytochrome P450 4c21 [Folsomia candida]OXA58692.1 Cytochrome P450 4c3 [Folsomia candida]
MEKFLESSFLSQPLLPLVNLQVPVLSLIPSPKVQLPFDTLVVLCLTISLVVFLLINDYRKTHLTRIAKMIKKLPGSPHRIPFIGQSYLLLGPAWNTQEVFSSYLRKYGTVCRMWIGDKAYILISDVSAAQKILGAPDLFEKASAYDNLRDFAGTGLLTSSGEQWKTDRKSLNHAFNHQLFTGFIKIFNHETNILMSKLENECGNPANLYPYFLTATLDMVLQAGLGVELNLQEKTADNIYATAINNLLSGTHIRLFKPHLYNIPFVYRLIGRHQLEKKSIAHIYKICDIARKRKQNEIKETKTDDDKMRTKPFLDILMDRTPQPTEKEYCDHLVTIIGAGAETTASSIYETLFFLALNSDHQKKAQEEVDTIIGSEMRELTLADISEAKYLEMCWKEAMRVKPPVAMVARKLTRDVTLDDGSILPNGAEVAIFIHHMHQDPEVYPNPKKFDPLRFAPEECLKRNAYSYLPFSMGNRNCIGLKYAQLEAKLILMYVLKKFNVTTKQRLEDIKFIFGVPAIPFPQFEVILERRT